jgi:predicted amidophosphoribosyltransferase
LLAHLRRRSNIIQTGALTQIRPKEKKQHQCVTDAERALNVKGIYAVTRQDLVSGKYVILVDDVLTSGATMHECATVLKSAGAMNVIGIALAKTARARGVSLLGNSREAA